ncbi:MAG TPA: class I SAM-dependent methyltransferase [Thermoanaerobaculia bacterium]|nr:class I SAM-dependent methyltransferase [Thermoanaerobaculia bacterium]
MVARFRFTDLRLLLAGLSPRSDPVTPLAPDQRLQVALSAYRFAAGHLDGAAALELACGTGFGCAELVGGGLRRAVGLEEWERPVRHARRRYGSQAVSFRVAPLDRLPDDLGPLDALVAWMVLQRVSAPEGVLTAVCSRLGERRRAVVSVPLLRSREELDAARASGMATALFPWFWAGVLAGFFDQVRPFRQQTREGVWVDLADRGATTLRPEDVRYVEVESPELLVEEPGLAAVFVCSR